DFSALLSPAFKSSSTAIPAGHNEVWCVLTVLWFAGVAGILFAWLRALSHEPVSVREPNQLELDELQGSGLGLRITNTGTDVGLWGLFRPVLALPDGFSAQLDGDELRAVILHEIAHARRWDNLVSGAVRAIAAIFWFHPLVWWIERRMDEERE